MALGLFCCRTVTKLKASASDRVRLDRPDSSSFSFASVGEPQENGCHPFKFNIDFVITEEKQNDVRSLMSPLSASLFCFFPLALDGTLSLGAVWWLAEAADSGRIWGSSTGLWKKVFHFKDNSCRIPHQRMKSIFFYAGPLNNKYQALSSAS